MNCEKIIELYLEYKETEDLKIKELIDQHIGSCAECSKKIGEIDFLLSAMNVQPADKPDAGMRSRFSDFIKEQQQKRAEVKVVRTLSRQLWIAASLILLVGIAILFLLLKQKAEPTKTELVRQAVPSENLFTNASAAVRIEAITQIDSTSLDQQLIKTLSGILLQDKNSNVRMAAVYGLASHLSNPSVYSVLIEALKKETDPVIQVLLMNTISLMKSPGSAEVIQSLINDTATRTEVKAVAEKIIKTL